MLTAATTSFAGVTAQFFHSHTKEMIILLPDDVYKKMTDYIVHLPDEAQYWMLLLGDTFFHVLTPEIQLDMLHHEFQMTFASRGLTESKKLGTLNDVRTAATQSHERSFIDRKNITKQVQASLAMVTSGGSLTFKMNVNSTSTCYKSFDNVPSYSINNDINLSGNDTTAQLYNYCSQAEQIMQQYDGN